MFLGSPEICDVKVGNHCIKHRVKPITLCLLLIFSLEQTANLCDHYVGCEVKGKLLCFSPEIGPVQEQLV